MRDLIRKINPDSVIFLGDVSHQWEKKEIEYMELIKSVYLCIPFPFPTMLLANKIDLERKVPTEHFIDLQTKYQIFD